MQRVLGCYLSTHIFYRRCRSSALLKFVNASVSFRHFSYIYKKKCLEETEAYISWRTVYLWLVHIAADILVRGGVEGVCWPKTPGVKRMRTLLPNRCKLVSLKMTQVERNTQRELLNRHVVWEVGKKRHDLVQEKLTAKKPDRT